MTLDDALSRRPGKAKRSTASVARRILRRNRAFRGQASRALLRIAGAAGYLEAERVAREVDTVDRIVAVLYKLAYRPR